MRFTNRIILILWAIGTGQFAACSDGGTEAPGPENGTQTIVWTPDSPVRGRRSRLLARRQSG